MGILETEIGGRERKFPETTWATARRRDSGAMQRLVSQYWKPVYCLIRHTWARRNEDAKDLTQEFFTRILIEGSLLESFSVEKGSFRSFLKSSIANFVRNSARDAQRQKRGGGTSVVPMSEDEAFPDPSAQTPEEAFDAAWKQEVLDRAMARVEERLRTQGKPRAFEVLRRYELESQSASYGEIGASLGMTADAVKHSLTLARKELRNAVLEVISDYVETPDDLMSEVRELFAA